MRLAITGANSSVGRNLLGRIAERGELTAVAGVRTRAAAATLPLAANLESAVVSYEDGASLERAFAGADSVVHLAGVLFESGGRTYQAANVDSTAAVVDAAHRAGAGHVVFVSSLAADAASANPYLRSKGEAEALIAVSGLRATTIRTPMLLGPEAAASAALLRTAGRGTALLLAGGRYTVRPLDIDDLGAAILGACSRPPDAAVTHELVGPEGLPYRDLIRRTAALLGTQVRIVGVPVAAAKCLAGISHLVRRGGISPSIIDVLTADEAVAANADVDLGIELTPLAETLEKLIRQR